MSLWLCTIYDWHKQNLRYMGQWEWRGWGVPPLWGMSGITPWVVGSAGAAVGYFLIFWDSTTCTHWSSPDLSGTGILVRSEACMSAAILDGIKGAVGAIGVTPYLEPNIVVSRGCRLVTSCGILSSSSPMMGLCWNHQGILPLQCWCFWPGLIYWLTYWVCLCWFLPTLLLGGSAWWVMTPLTFKAEWGFLYCKIINNVWIHMWNGYGVMLCFTDSPLIKITRWSDDR